MVRLNTISTDNAVNTIHLRIGGCVQGVGFRPHVYHTATQLGIDGWVRNQCGEVEVFASGSRDNINRFIHQLIEDAPAISSPNIVNYQIIKRPSSLFWRMPESWNHPSPLDPGLRRDDGDRGFSIINSAEDENSTIHLPLDLDCCPNCLNELNDSNNRRYRYPFINCTQCGPRYTAITQLPYDRRNTNMANFPRCTQCEKEYNDPADRRFHAEATCCPECGPQLTFVENGTRITDSTTALNKTLETLRAGKTIAVKGTGGYHLLCSANNDEVIKKLRAGKDRPDKPLAVMFSNLAAAQRELIIEKTAATLLCDRSRPIVLCDKQATTTLSPLIAPGTNRIGALLPYSPLHQLILDDFGKPLIATSANISGEPVMTDATEVEKRLGNIADAFLHHSRTITHAADDSLFQIINNKPRPLRLGRGHTPLELTLPITLNKPLLAVGGQMKNTIALAWENRVVISPHIGELESPRSIERFKATIDSLQQHYGISAEAVICDAHSGYHSSRWASACGLPKTDVYHHHAHASAVVGEHNIKGQSLIFTWDGSGLGEDGILWGGEALLGQPGQWQRVASMRPFRLPGGEAAAREPWRCATSLCWHSGESWNNHPQATLLHEAWRKGINAPTTSSVGRLFDGAAALLGLIDKTSFEGQAAMLLQASAETVETKSSAPLPSSVNSDDILISDWQPLLKRLRDTQQSVAERAACFHSTIASTLCDQALQLRQQQGDFVVGLNGGVFQNKLLTEQAITLLEQQGFEVYLPQQLPCNDAALCYGQIIEAAARL
jgi:hydrogenase maturation protein HypF